ncbi:hypothetical protein BJ742DRAFT_743830 [Cladochytrium replicatum]|nr:hypothetical protein BJ742DRAFT_743830 [Cladochytrium replicatum]
MPGSETSPTTPNTFSRRKVKSNAWRYEEMREEDMDEEALEALRREQEETELLLEYARGKGGENIENEVIEDAFTEIPWYLRKDLPADKLNPHAYMKVDVATLLKKVNPEKSSDIDSQPKSHIERNFASTKTKRMFTTNPDADSLQKKTEAEDELDDILKLANRKGPTSSVTKPVGTKAQLNDTDIDDFMAELGLSDQNAPQKHSHPSNNATTKAAQDLGWLDSLLS